VPLLPHCANLSERKGQINHRTKFEVFILLIRENTSYILPRYAMVNILIKSKQETALERRESRPRYALSILTKLLFHLFAAFICVSFVEACRPLLRPEMITRSSLKEASLKNLIPLPVSIRPGEGGFPITSRTVIVVDSEIDEELETGRFLADKLHDVTGYPIRVAALQPSSKEGNIILTISDSDDALGEEGYELTVTESFLKIKANRSAGLFWGIQTVIQLLPPVLEGAIVSQAQVEIPAVAMMDYPRFAWRGAMLDVARHFFSVQDVERFIDWMALYKMNRFHIHLTDDQGWRIMIHSWPNLALHGGSTQTGGGQGGYYTQAEYTEIVTYAQKRHILVVPEIDMPGHTNAALASYPALNCDGTAPSLYTGIEVGFSTLCTEKDSVRKFIEDIVREICSLTPGQYIHIGGDEASATSPADYIRFIDYVQSVVRSNNKQLIGWGEVARAHLLPSSIIQYWNDRKAFAAGTQNKRFIMSPGSKAYMDMKYDSSTVLGQNWAGYIEVEKAYNWDPVSEIAGASEHNILGLEAALWTETIRTIPDIEYMTFPRLPGYAEIGWSQQSKRNWEEYRIRLSEHGKRWAAMGINFYKSPQVQWK
jgi:hexosaminidase